MSRNGDNMIVEVGDISLLLCIVLILSTLYTTVIATVMQVIPPDVDGRMIY